MSVKLKTTWIFELTTPEVSLIRRALRGTLKIKEGDRDLAVALEEDLVKNQLSQVDHFSNEMEKLRKNIGSQK